MPFTDPSGDRLRAWMAVDDETFYDDTRIAIVPMGFCFPGLDSKGSDFPPRPECAPAWRSNVMAALPNLRLILLVGSYAIKWHLGDLAHSRMHETVGHWRDYAAVPVMPGSERQVHIIPTPHPSWRNNAWLKRNIWFEQELLLDLRTAVTAALEKT